MILKKLDWRSPLAAFAPLAAREGAALLHGGDLAGAARWSFIVAAPSTLIESHAGETRINGARTGVSPFKALSDLHQRRKKAARDDGSPPFAGGLVGFCGYECGRFVEPGVDFPASPYGFPDFRFGAYDAVAVFDRESCNAFILAEAEDAAARLEKLLGKSSLTFAGGAAFGAPRSNFTRIDYRGAVEAVVERIRNGDFYQANISQRIETVARGEVDPFEIFCTATPQSSAEFGAYFPLSGGALISLSPERFFRTAAKGGRLAITAEPIKGTRPRGRTASEDARLLAELQADPKERAENIMIADLTRNDLSRICEDHSIREEAICETRTHASVHHLVSRISGTLREDVGAAEALSSMFPCGSITGAPKVEAMKAIAAVEREGRGPYCGAIGYIDDAGGADFSVAIRLAIVEGRKVSIPVGGGVTLRSDPSSEYDETLAKAAQFMRRFNLEENALS